MLFNPKLKFFIFSEWHINHSEKIITSVFLGDHFVASGKDRTESDAQAQCIRETQGPWPKGTLGLTQKSESKQNLLPTFVTVEKTDSRSLALGYLRPHSKAREQTNLLSPLSMSRTQTPGPWP